MVTLNNNLVVAPLGAVLIALGTVTAAPAATFYGESQSLGEGSVRSYFTVDDNTGKVLELGISLTEGALSVPTGNDAQEVSNELSLSSEASGATAVQTAEVIYSPNSGGTGPESVFTVPRYRFSFFYLSSEQRDQICPNPGTVTYTFMDLVSSYTSCVGDELAQAVKTPEPEAIPDGFQGFEAGNELYAQPRYGTRYADPSLFAPVAMGQVPFTSNYNYGYFDGQWSFAYIVVTKDFLESKPDGVVNSLAQPEKYPGDGIYPTEYVVTYDSTTEEYRLGLRGWKTVPENSPAVGLLGLGLCGAVLLGKKKLKKLKLAS
ncbi:hypothetical protein [Cylindrospermum sp. FACHB-282]|uniref:hypothetical protein n=1 Tax=Cylindrospermum sp. FACHB-282 TaxID=2692794 RepID=UPI001686FB25|nr:hypothetical protein [Cylindrospermum sp. FACHB-282]MBD2385494.1 hypothetical protein [Cylindrospermum sp. FACHB-282]